jgi:parvulin-like peptidyl-prolyl isomerase
MSQIAEVLPTHDRQTIDRVSIRRSLILLAVGAFIGLALAGYALFTAKGTSTLVVPAEYVALVNQQPISRIDFAAQLQTLYAVDLAHSTRRQRQTVLDGMIREELFVQRGKELDVASVDADVRAATVAAVGQIVAADAIAALPTDVQLRAYYGAHRQDYASEGTILARDLVFANQADAARAALTLSKEALTPGLVERLHAKPSGKLDGEEFYFAARIHLGEALFNAAHALPDGGVSSPVAAKDGYHVIIMCKNTKPLPFAFEEIRGEVLTDYRTDKIARMQADENRFLRKRSNILIAGDMR